MSGYATFSQLGRYGRFANQIYQIAGTIGIARKNGLQPVFRLWRNYDHAERFGSKEDINVFNHFKNQLPGVHLAGEQWNQFGVAWGYQDISLPSGNWDIHGHLQSPKYFNHCIDEVRHYMTMVGENDDYIPAICLHARRGDYDNKYHPVIPVEWYINALKHFPVSFNILVFSDSKIFVSQLSDMLCIHGMTGHANNLIPIYKDYLESFKIMKRCQHFIIGNSSYSAAAATLSDFPGKQVIAPKQWFGPAYTNITAKDIYQPTWKVI